MFLNFWHYISSASLFFLPIHMGIWFTAPSHRLCALMIITMYPLNLQVFLFSVRDGNSMQGTMPFVWETCQLCANFFSNPPKPIKNTTNISPQLVVTGFTILSFLGIQVFCFKCCLLITDCKNFSSSSSLHPSSLLPQPLQRSSYIVAQRAWQKQQLPKKRYWEAQRIPSNFYRGWTLVS